jgi:hypothetical protein
VTYPLHCDLHNKDFKNESGARLHFTKSKDHMDVAVGGDIPVEDPYVPAAAAVAAPLVRRDPEGEMNYKLTPGVRSLKMLAPRCECHRTDQAGGWWYRCLARGHDPYFSPDHYGERTEEVLGAPNAAGEQEVVDTKTIKVKVLGGPNFVAIPYTGRHSGDESVAMRKARGKGYRKPEELGLSPRCQFHNCWVKLDLPETNTLGPRAMDFCIEEQYRVIRADSQGIFLEVLNETKKDRQWATLAS